MAMGATLTIKNETGSLMVVTSVAAVYDDATFTGIAPQQTIKNGETATQSMANSSVFLAPKGVGCQINFMVQDKFGAIGAVRFGDPAVGTPTFDYGSPETFSYSEQNTGGNSYLVTVKLA